MIRRLILKTRRGGEEIKTDFMYRLKGREDWEKFLVVREHRKGKKNSCGG